MEATIAPVTQKENLVLVGYEDEYHIKINKISLSVEAYFGDKQKSRGVEYSTLEEAVMAAQAIYNYRQAII